MSTIVNQCQQLSTNINYCQPISTIVNQCHNCHPTTALEWMIFSSRLNNGFHHKSHNFVKPTHKQSHNLEYDCCQLTRSMFRLPLCLATRWLTTTLTTMLKAFPLSWYILTHSSSTRSKVFFLQLDCKKLNNCCSLSCRSSPSLASSSGWSASARGPYPNPRHNLDLNPNLDPSPYPHHNPEPFRILIIILILILILIIILILILILIIIPYLIFVISFTQAFGALEIFYTQNALFVTKPNLHQKSVNRSNALCKIIHCGKIPIYCVKSPI